VFVATDDVSRLDYWLHHPRAVSDLEAMGEALEDGVAVTLYGPAGGEQPAMLRFQAEVNCWIAYPLRESGRDP
jgi:hypothetical protein